jgi:hypothetical protein
MTRAVVAACAAALLLSGCGSSGNGIAVQGTSNLPDTTAHTSPPPTTSTAAHTGPCGSGAGCVARRISIRSDAAIAFDSGTLWVAAQPGPGLFGTLTQVDALTGQRAGAAPVPLPASSERYRLAAGGGGVWLAGAGQVWQIDPSSGQLQHTVPAGGPVTGLVFAAGSVWAIARTPGGGEVLRINSTDGSVAKRVVVPGVDPSAITVAAGSVWIADAAHFTVLQLRSANLRPVRKPIRLPQHPRWRPTQLTVMFGKVWVYDRGAAIGLSAGSGGLLYTQPFAAAMTSGDMAGGGNDLWVASTRKRTGQGVVLRLNPAGRGNRLGRPIVIGGRVTALATGDGLVWAMDGAHGILYEIAPAP